MLVSTLIAQAATDYNFYVGGVKVTSDNCSNITGSNITSGTAVFTPSNNTLTLTNVTITRTGTDNRAIQSDRSGLIVKLVGTNNLSASSASVIRFNQPGSIVVSSGTTTVTGGTEGGVYSNNVAVTVSGPGKLIVKSTNDKYGFEGKGTSSSSTLTFTNVNVEASGKKGALYDWARVTVNAGSHIVLKATSNSSYPVASNLAAMTFNGNEVVASPSDAYYSNPYQGIIKDGSLIYDKTIHITDNYAVLININNFPDANFRSYMLSNYPLGYMTTSEVDNCTGVYVNGRNISNLKGIERLTGVEALNCSDNNLTSLNVSACTKLLSLYCRNNAFTSLDISNLPLLTTLDVKNNASLTKLLCNNNSLTSVYLDGCNQLQELDCSYNYLGSLNLTDCKQLKKFTSYNNNLAELDLDGCYQIEEIFCTGSQMTIFSITGKEKLKALYLNDNYNLKWLYCNSNALTQLSVGGCSALEGLDCRSNSLTSLYLSDCVQLRSVYCNNNALTAFIPPQNLQVLECGNNNFTSITLTGLSKLTSLNVSNNAQMTALICQQNALTVINLTGCTKLQKLNCYSNHLASLDISPCTQLQQLYCYDNYFSEQGMTALISNLPDRSTTTSGNLRVLYSTGENNVFNNTHATDARAKNWLPYRHDGTNWTEIAAALIGDVNSDGYVNISDVTYLINLLLNNASAPDAADVNTDGSVNISDVTTLINILLNGH